MKIKSACSTVLNAVILPSVAIALGLGCDAETDQYPARSYTRELPVAAQILIAEGPAADEAESVGPSLVADRRALEDRRMLTTRPIFVCNATLVGAFEEGSPVLAEGVDVEFELPELAEGETAFALYDLEAEVEDFDEAGFFLLMQGVEGGKTLFYLQFGEERFGSGALARVRPFSLWFPNGEPIVELITLYPAGETQTVLGVEGVEQVAIGCYRRSMSTD